VVPPPQTLRPEPVVPPPDDPIDGPDLIDPPPDQFGDPGADVAPGPPPVEQ
jgi:hypothetical protein